MKIVVEKEKEPVTLTRNRLIKGKTYTNVNCHGSFFIYCESINGSGVVNLYAGVFIVKDSMLESGWIEVEAEVHIK